jgi:amylovoran biosynthesis glycosyltransferase AmsE
MSSKSIEGDNDISVVINVWGKDSPHALRRSLRSIGNQTLNPSEVLIVIDGPINAQLEGEIAKFEVESSFEVRVIRVSVATGLWNGRNVGIAEARNEIIALHDADDLMHPERLQIQIMEMKRLLADVCFTQAMEFNTINEKIVTCRVYMHEVVDLNAIFWNNILSHSSAMLKRKTIIEIGGYRNVYFSEDYDLWLRLIIAGKRVKQSKIVLQALGVDSGHVDRRGGFQFVKSENSIHRMIKDTQEFPSLTLLIRRILRLIYRLGPKLIRKTHRGRLTSRKTAAFPKTLTEFLDTKPVNCESHL